MGLCRAVNNRLPVTAVEQRATSAALVVYCVHVFYAEGKWEFFQPFSTTINQNRQVCKKLFLFTDTSFMLRSHGNGVPLLKNP